VGACLFKLRGHTSPVACLAIAVDGRLLSGGADGSVRVWAPLPEWCGADAAVASSLVAEPALGAGGAAAAVGLAPAGLRMLACARADGSLALYRLELAAALAAAPANAPGSHPFFLDSQTSQPPGAAAALAPLADGRVVSGGGGALKAWDVEVGAAVSAGQQPPDGGARGAAAAAVAAAATRFARLSRGEEWRAGAGAPGASETDSEGARRNAGHDVTALAALPGGRVVSGDAFGLLYLWE
jgi:hypothetical protein